MSFKKSIGSLVCITLITSSFSHLTYAEVNADTMDLKTLVSLVTKNQNLPTTQTTAGLRNVSPKLVEAPNPVEFQRPDNFFADGKMPKSFEKMATQRAEWIHHKDEIVARVENDKTRTDLSNLVIIDIGGDLGNPEVRKRLNWQTENGKVTGAGHDYRGNDGWASAVILDPWIFAIGAKGINTDGQIVGQIERPLEYLTNLNDALVKQLMERIQANPKLNNTFFQKINTTNTTILGLIRISGFEIDSELIGKLSSAGQLVQPNSNAEVLTQNAQLKFTHDFAKAAWVMDPSSGLPDIMSHTSLETLAGMDILLQEIQALYTAENKTFVELMKNIIQTATYLKKHHFNVGAPTSDIMNYTFGKITQQLAFKKIGTVMMDPSYNLLLDLRAKKIQNPEISWKQIVDNTMNVYRKVLGSVANHEDTRQEYSQLSAFVSGFRSADEVEKFILERSKEYDYDKQVASLNATGRVPWTQFSSEMRKHAIRVFHPLLHPESIDADHATHIMLTGIPFMGENYRADLFAVNLGMTKAIKPIQLEMVQKNLKAMYAWMQIPLVARAIHKKLSEDVGLDLSKINIESPQGRLQLAEFMTRHYQGNFLNDASAGGIVGQNLHWELTDRIEKVALASRPYANLSLGGTLEQPDLRPTMNTPEKKLGIQLNFIFGEFQKYIIADAVVKKAPHTTFFMAAGNSNNFGDGGMIRSDYPADLRSKWLNENALPGEYLPAEKADNIVIVMSNNERGVPSSFTNVVFTNKTIFSTRGEDIVAGTFRFNLSGVETTIQTEAPWLYQARSLLATLSPDDSRLEAIYAGLKITAEDFVANRKLILQTLTTQIMQLKIQHNDYTKLMNGTSMASPTAAFTTMKHNYDTKRKLLKLSEKEVYGKPGFLPADTIKMMQDVGVWKKIGEVEGNNIKYTDLQKMQKMMPDSQKKTSLIRLLGEIKESSALCIKFYEIKR